LFSRYYPIIGPVEPFQASTWAEKRVYGALGKDDETLESSWIIDDKTEGIGILDMEEEKDAKRYWWGTGDTDTKGHLIHSTLVTDATNPTGVDAQILIEYGNRLFASFGQSVRLWVEATASWTAEQVALASWPTDAIVHKDKLYIACGSDFERYDRATSTWTTGTALSGSAQAARYLLNWDSKLLKVDNDGQLSWSVDEGVTWTENAPSTLPSGYFNKLFTGKDALGDPLPWLGTKEGPLALNFDDAEWVPTRLTMPFHDYACMGGVAFKNDTYVSAGLQVHEVGEDINVMGLDRDSGIPNDYNGSIIGLYAGHNDLFAIVDATKASTADEANLFIAGAYGDVRIVGSAYVGYSVVFKWRWATRSWRPMYISESDATGASAGVICSADDEYRFWFAMDGSVFYIPLQTTIQNPLEVTDFPFSATMEHIEPNFDADNAVITKTGTRFGVYVTGTSATEYPMYYYRTDYATDWILLVNDDFPDGKVITDGEHEFTFASDAGLEFKAFQPRVVSVRGSTTTVCPDTRWMRLKYLKMLPVRRGHRVTIDCSRSYRNQTSKVMEDALWTALGTRTLGKFTFRNGNGSETHMVMLMPPFEGAAVGGRSRKGVYKALLVSP